MVFDDLKEYFEKYVKDFKPYRSIPLYQEIVDFLLNKYLDDSYSNLPVDFKTAFETQIIPINFYDLLLTSNGFPKKIVSKLSSNDKIILLNSMMDFNRFKGSLKTVSSVVNSFNESINVYELYIDFRANKWVFVPRPIHISAEIKEELKNTTIKFSTISDQVNNFFITENQLTKLRNSKNICLPIKSNLLLMDFKIVEKGNTLLNLFAAITLKEFRNELISLFFDDGSFTIPLESVYKLWYYINFKFTGSNIVFTHLTSYPFVLFDIDNPALSFTTADIPNIESQLEDIVTTNDASEFYFTNINEPFKVDRTWNVNITINELEILYRSELGSDLIDFINKTIDGASTQFQKKTATLKLLDQITNSLITWSVVNDNDISYLLDSLSKISFSAKETPSFLILDHLKPFHTQIIPEAGKLLRVKDKFNSEIVDEKITIISNVLKTSILNTSDRMRGVIDIILKTNVHEISDDDRFVIDFFSQSIESITDIFNMIINHENHSILNSSHNFAFESEEINHTLNVFSHRLFTNILNTNNEVMNIQEDVKNKSIQFDHASISEMSDNFILTKTP